MNEKSILRKFAEELMALFRDDTEEAVTRPYVVVKEDDKWCVYKEGSDGGPVGDTLGCHDTEQEAEDQIAAIWANEESRDLDFGSLHSAILDGLYDLDYEYPYVIDVMQGSDGMYFVFASGAKLYRADYSIDSNDVVKIEKVQQVKLDYPVVEDESGENRAIKPVLRVFRDADGQLKFLAIAASAVLNRVGEIDTTMLFDSFEEEFKERDNPYLSFLHLGEVFSFGTVQGVFRLDSLLFAFGDIDEQTILGKVAEERFSTGEWGLSIGFIPTEQPKLIEVGGTKIRTFNKGYLVEISVLKEEIAAAYFTTILNVEREINRMGKNRDQAKEALLEFAGEDAEDEVEALLDQAKLRERQIHDEGMITRETEEKTSESPEEAAEEAAEAEEETVETEVVAEEAGEDLEETAETSVELEVDESFIEELVTLVADRVTAGIQESLKTIDELQKEMRREIDKLNAFVERVNQFIDSTNEAHIKFEKRIAAVEKSEDEKIRDAVSDLPSVKTKKTIIAHRPTKDNGDGNKAESVPDLRKIAEATLEGSGLNLSKYKSQKAAEKSDS